MRTSLSLVLVLILAFGTALEAQKRKADAASTESEETARDEILDPANFTALGVRSIGPALVSGRIGDLAVHPLEPWRWIVAVASGGVWKTDNAGTTFTPIFDSQGSYSIGTVTLDPADPKVIWVGTGENNSQRSVSYGDGVYVSRDGGTSWKNVGLNESEHIGRIVVDPRDSNVVWVASQGPLWSSGGDRGLYKTEDGGESWELALEIDEHTGVSEVWLDPRDPDVMYAVSYQRARRVWTLINGGPGSGLWKSTDGGESWQRLSNGLPGGDLGRIGMTISPADPDVLYAIVEHRDDEKAGVYRSTDAGWNWQRRSGYLSSSPQYYQELVSDPHDVDRVYSLDTFLMVTEDGGKTWVQVGQEKKHVDEHALWIDPRDTDHLLSGNDGGVYESWDRGQTWRFMANLPVTQFYKIEVDNDEPFYNVYGGTQDNNTIGCPTQTLTEYGITNSDCYITVGGDGFQTRVDPTNPDIVYSQWQYGNLIRFDRRSGEVVDIKPIEEVDDEPLRWNWDSPLIISPHSHTRLYFAAQRVYRSDDRGDSWTPISGDLTRQLDRDRLEVMDQLWPIDAVAKHDSTSIYGNLTALAESPRVEGLLYAGTDDGLVQVLEPGSESWRRIDELPGVPELSYIAYLEASPHADDTVFVVANNHKQGDFLPYLLRSDDRGRTWRSIAGDLPERGSTWAVQQDPIDPSLLFVGTEFGAFFTLDGGEHWLELQGGLPTIAVRDLAIQEREHDLVLGTFGRGFYVLDDYRPLRGLDRERLASNEALLWAPETVAVYVESDPLGDFLGHDHWRAPNPPFGATFTYWLKEESQTLRQERQEREKELIEAEEELVFPSLEELRVEERERAPQTVLTVTDSEGNVVRRLAGKSGKGMHRVTWDLRWPPADPIRPGASASPWYRPTGPLAVPGSYRVSLERVVRGETQTLAEPVTFEVRALDHATLAAPDREALAAFEQKVASLQRAVLGASAAGAEADARLDLLRTAAEAAPIAAQPVLERLDSLELELEKIRLELEGDRLASSRNLAVGPSIRERVSRVVQSLWTSTAAPTATQSRQYEIVAAEFPDLLERLRRLIEEEITAIERELEAAGAPWTPGRVPEWRPEN